MFLAGGLSACRARTGNRPDHQSDQTRSRPTLQNCRTFFFFPSPEARETNTRPKCLSKDWHCPDHVSFANIHPGHKPFDVITLTYNSKNELCKTDESGTCPDAVDCRAELAWNETRQLQQTLWPAHCIINDPESELDDSLLTKEDDHFVLKGSRCSVDSYSAFFDNARFESTGLHDHLRGRGITRVFVAGLALDYCVKYTALDAKSLGYDVYVVVDATRGTSPSSAERAIEELKNSGVRLINSSEIEKCFKKKKNGSVVAVTLLLVAAALLVRRAKKRTQ
ncbi:nicotinamidase-like [Schistocerca gregaria]|uniref:nicotinamidase-like n=1 Tax=Schistocerca gregaria TaxID=7010 RepID=UPI00211DCF13|nr:nicotinamidase-like [Schistocerca gregaria]